MRFVVLAVLLQLAAPGWAAQLDLPSAKEQLGLPDPLPWGFNECVLVVWSPESSAKINRRGTFFDPPLSTEDIETLNHIRSGGLGQLVMCDELNT